MKTEVKLDTSEDLAAGLQALITLEPRFALALEQAGPPPLRRRGDGFQALASAIVSQQVSVASANAIKARLESADLLNPETVQHCDEETLRAHGLSRQKARYFKALASAGIDFDALKTAPDDTVIATLTAVPGIGQWTAQIYAMFSLGRADVFPQADLALQEAAMHLFSLEARPKPKALADLAATWSPWRSVAATMLWHYYRHLKHREGI